MCLQWAADPQSDAVGQDSVAREARPEYPFGEMRSMKLLATLLWCSCAFAQMLSSQDSAALKAEHIGLHGPVRNVHIETRANCASDPKCPPPAEIEDRSYTADGWISEVSISHEGKQWWHGVCRRNAKQLLQCENETNQANLQAKEVATYDSNGRRSEILTYELDGTLRERVVFRYEDGRTYDIVYNSSGELVGTYVLETREVKQTELGTHEERRWYKRDATVLVELVKDTDKNGTLVRQSHKNGIVETTTKDSTGRTLSDTQHEAGKGSMKRYFGPDQRLARLEYYGPGGELKKAETFAYQDDEHGNWIRQIRTDQWTGGKPRDTAIVTRTITYY